MQKIIWELCFIVKVACPLEAIDDCLATFSTKAVTKTLLKTRIWWQNSYQNIFVVLVVWMFCRTKTSKNSRLQRPIENFFFSFHSNCQILHGHLALNARHGGRALTRGGCLHKEIRWVIFICIGISLFFNVLAEVK